MSPPVSQHDVGLVVGDRYRLIAKIGTGPSATVYLADDIRLRRRVAVKILHAAFASEPAFVDAFGAEMPRAAALRHPHIGMVHDWGVDGAPFIVGEYLQAGSLRGLVDRGVRLDPSQALQLTLAAARALAYAHDNGVVHRDLHPGNLLFADDGRLKIVDFGLARAHAQSASTRPMGAEVLGVRYASPEQARGSDIDGRSDVYSLVLIVIEAVSGAVPFIADTALATVLARIDRAPRIPETLGAMTGPLERASTIDPAERLDAAELVTALMAVADAFADPEPLDLGDGVPTPGTPVEHFEDITLVVAPGVAVPADPDVVPHDETEAAPHEDTEPVVASTIGGPPSPSGPEVPGARDGVGATPDDTDFAADAARVRRNRRRWRVAWFVFALVVIVGGGAVSYLVWQAQRTPTHPVPSVAGLDVDEARARLGDLGFVVATRDVRRDGTHAGDLLGTEPDAGKRVAEGATVTLIVSAGQTLVTVPAQLAGMTEDEAAAAVRSAGLEPGPSRTAHSEDVEAGRVIGSDPAVGTRLERGSQMVLVVSDGPKPRVVPTVTGMGPDEAEAALRDVGLVPHRVERYDTAVDTGGLIGLDPGPGTTVPRGTTVDVVVSKGLLVAVPSLDGITTVSGAIEALQAAGLQASALGGTGSLSGRPVAFDPPAGQLVVKGSAVDILVE